MMIELFKNRLQIVASINVIKSNSVGLDEVPISFIKALMSVILPLLTHVFNANVTKSIFPIVGRELFFLYIRVLLSVHSMIIAP